MPISATDRATLDALLTAHRPSDGAEADSLVRIRAFVDSATEPFDRRTLPGHLTGSAFVVDGDGRLLLVHHRRLGLWLQLGGHAEGEADAAAVALREAIEESGLDHLVFHPAVCDAAGRPLLLDVDVHPIPPAGAEPAHLHFDLRFLLTTTRPADVAHVEAESHALAWVELDEARRRCDAGIGRAADKIERVIRDGAAGAATSAQATATGLE
ncbi:MAG: NUDIX hydrolase [Ardenticatenales bacterium]|nr:NUDIX hydrolase [Ardenticatenales bacterium]